MFGSMVGLFIPAALQSGFVIIGVSPYWQTVAVGAILIAAVYVDQQRRAAASRGQGRLDQAPAAPNSSRPPRRIPNPTDTDTHHHHRRKAAPP